MEEKAECSLIRKKQSFLRETVSLWRRALERLNWLGTLYLSLVWAVSVTQHFTPCQMGTSAPCQHYCNPYLHRIFDFKAWTLRKWKTKRWFEYQKNPTKQWQQQQKKLVILLHWWCLRCKDWSLTLGCVQYSKALQSLPVPGISDCSEVGSRGGRQHTVWQFNLTIEWLCSFKLVGPCRLQQ